MVLIGVKIQGYPVRKFGNVDLMPIGHNVVEQGITFIGVYENIGTALVIGNLIQFI